MGQKRAIILIGAGRSGSTVLHEILSWHRQLAWLPRRIADTHPERPAFVRSLMSAVDVPLVRAAARALMKPGECYAFWDHYFPGFSKPCRDLRRGDLSGSARKRIRAVTTRMLTKSRDRLLLKITGWPRVDFLSGVFDDAIFVHVLRDGRAVAHSLINTEFWQGWQGPQKWRWGELPPHLRSIWQKHDQSFLILAAIQWRIMLDSIEKVKSELGRHRFIEVKYEDLCAHQVASLEALAESCELRWDAEFRKRVESFRLVNANYRWRQVLTSTQQEGLQGVLEDKLRKHGYS